MEIILFYIAAGFGAYALILRAVFRREKLLSKKSLIMFLHGLFWTIVGVIGASILSSHLGRPESLQKFMIILGILGFFFGIIKGFFQVKGVESSKKLLKEDLEWADTGFYATFLCAIVMMFVIQAFKIPTGSMRPTLIEGDRLLVNKFIYRFKEPERGDVIVFIAPEDKKKDFIKRLIGLPGDKIEIRNGTILVNGKRIEDSVIEEIYYYNRGTFGDTYQEIDVPEDSYYVLGDNSISSRDSRYWGFVPKKYLKGKALVIYWPLTRLRIIK